MLTLIFIYLNPLLMHLYYFVDDGSVGSVLFDIALMFTLSVHVMDLSFDRCWVRPCPGHV